MCEGNAFGCSSPTSSPTCKEKASLVRRYCSTHISRRLLLLRKELKAAATVGEDDGFVGIVGSCGRGGGTIKGIVFGGRKSGKYGKRTDVHARGRKIKLRFSAEDRQNPLARTTGTILPNSHFASFLARIPTYSVQAIRPLRPLVFRRFPLLPSPHLFLLAFLRPRGSRRRRKRRKCR